MQSKDIIRSTTLMFRNCAGWENQFQPTVPPFITYRNSSLACCQFRLWIIESSNLPTPFQYFQVILFGCSQISRIFVCGWILNHLLLWRSVTLCFGGRMEYMKQDWRHLNISLLFVKADILLLLIFWKYR